MPQYRYTGKINLDFVYNGVPSHLHEGMIIKPRLIDYMMRKYPSQIQEVSQVPSTPSQVQEIKPVIIPPKVTTPTVSTESDSHLDESEISPMFTVTQEEVDITKLTSYDKVLELYKNDLVDICTKFDLDTVGRKSELVERVCQHLNIPINR